MEPRIDLISIVTGHQFAADDRPGGHVEAGQRIGMIRFGSRVNCEIPAGYELCVSVGDHVTAGKSVIARKAGS